MPIMPVTTTTTWPFMSTADAARQALQRKASQLLRRNMSGAIAPYSKRYGRRDDQGVGAKFARVLRALREDPTDSDLWEELAEVLNCTNPTTRRALLARCTDNDLSPEEHIYACEHCGSYGLTQRSEGRTEDGGDLCSDCTEDHYTYSNCMGCHIRNDEVVDVYLSLRSLRRRAPDDYCTLFYAGQNFMSYDDDYMDEDTYDQCVMEDGSDSDNEDEDNAAHYDGLMGYHCSPRHFAEVNGTPSIPALGVELEVYSKNRADSVRAARNVTSGWYFEEDGSLDEDYGFELISQPLGQKEWSHLAPYLLGALAETGALAYSQPTSGSYGIHVNVLRSHLSPLQEARLLLFMHAAQNREFLVAIAQRTTIYGGARSTQFGGFTPADQTVAAVGGLTDSGRTPSGALRRKPLSKGKYSALNFHNNLAEFRLFQSTLHLPSFMKNLEFVWALLEWTSTKAATGALWGHENFVAWLGTAHGSEQKYPNLFAYLRKPSYIGRDFARLKNTWAVLLPKQTTKSLDVVSGDADQRLAA